MTKRELKDQLEGWAKENPIAPEVDPRVAAAAKAKQEKAARAAADAAREASLTDEELFQRAVKGVDNKARVILEKYDDEEPPEREKPPPPDPKVRDRALFLDAVADAAPVPAKKKKPAR